ncbi:DJ-1/PfpI family protein [Candidatus Woesearchaeota archaeon]|nr:DJ-1/PfpI family protein [Candidatus Woesearchaeota archaeon]
MVNILYIIAKEGFQDHELFDTKGVLDQAGYSAIIASASEGECKGALGGTANADISIKAALQKQFDAVVCIGGPGALSRKGDSDSVELARQAVSDGKVVGAICIAPLILAEAGVLKGKKATAWNGDGKQSVLLAEKGAEFTGEPVTIDGRIVTANGPPAATAFGEALVKVITESQ